MDSSKENWQNVNCSIASPAQGQGLGKLDGPKMPSLNSNLVIGSFHNGALGDFSKRRKSNHPTNNYFESSLNRFKQHTPSQRKEPVVGYYSEESMIVIPKKKSSDNSYRPHRSTLPSDPSNTDASLRVGDSFKTVHNSKESNKEFDKKISTNPESCSDSQYFQHSDENLQLFSDYNEEDFLFNSFDDDIFTSLEDATGVKGSVDAGTLSSSVGIEGKKTFDHTNLWGLPPKISEILREKKINHFFEWQISCLNNESLLSGKNMVISIPTSGGKTLISEILILRSCLLRKKKSLLVLPYISLVLEKSKSLKRYKKVENVKVEAYYNNKGSIPITQDSNVLVCTFERANSIINNLIEEKRLDELGCVVIDEFHMIGEKERGHLLEVIVTKLKFLQTTKQQPSSVQIIGMSATIPNMESFAQWIGGDFYCNTTRPIPLVEYIKVGDCIYDVNNQIVRTLPKPKSAQDKILSSFSVPGLSKHDIYHIYFLCKEVTPDDSVIVFCSSKKLASTLVSILASLHTSQEMSEDRKLVVKKLESCQNETTLDPVLSRGVRHGIAYHHSGLTVDEREIIESSFLERTINIICCTSTLAAGVNLPAKRVLLQRKMGVRNLSQIEYRQMIGRAGRAGLNTHGEAYLLLTHHEKDEGMKMVQSPLEPIKSGISSSIERLTSLNVCGNGMQTFLKESGSLGRLILDCITGELCSNHLNCTELILSTFLGFLSPREAVFRVVSTLIAWLIEKKFIIEREDKDNGFQHDGNSGDIDIKTLEPTPLGKATFRSSFSPDESQIIISELERSRDNLVLSDPLHLCYLVTPLFQSPYPNSWVRWSNIFHELPANRIKLASIIGIKANYILEKESSPNASIPDLIEITIKRFFAALMFLDIIAERSISEVSKKFLVSRGDIESLIACGASFGSQMVSFCKHMGWWDLEFLLHKYSQTISAGVRSELIPLTEIKGIKSFRAKVLWENGIRTIKQVACVDEKLLETLFKRYGYFSLSEARKIKLRAQKIIEKTVMDMKKAAQELLNNES